MTKHDSNTNTRKKTARSLTFTSGPLKFRHTEPSIIYCLLNWKNHYG